MGEGQRRYVIDAKTRKGETVDERPKIIVRTKKVAATNIAKRDASRTDGKIVKAERVTVSQTNVEPGSAVDVANKKIAAEYRAQRERKQRDSATKDYLSAVERTNQIHADLMKVRRDLARAKKSGSEADVAKLSRADADMTKAYATGRAKVKMAEKSLADAGIDPTDKQFATKSEREKLYAEKPSLKPEMKKDEREERAKAAEALEMDSDPEEVLGFLPAPAEIKGEPPAEFHKLTDADYDNVGKRETPPPIEMPLPSLLRDNAPVAPATPKSAWDKTKRWIASSPVGRATIWAGAGLAALLSMNVGPRHEIETPSHEQSALSVPAEDLGSVSVDDANVEISQPPVEAPAATTTTPEVALPSANVSAEDEGVTINSADDLPDSWTNVKLSPSPESLVVSAPDKVKVAKPKRPSVESEEYATPEEAKAGAAKLVENISNFDMKHPETFGLSKAEAERMIKGDPNKLFGALAIWKNTPGKYAYQRELSRAEMQQAKAELQSLRETSKIIFGPSPVLAGLAHERALKEVEAVNKAWQKAYDSAPAELQKIISQHQAEQKEIERQMTILDEDLEDDE